jgi:murein DD-endopeptidase MepM/ murein hydrolase activator NlpD
MRKGSLVEAGDVLGQVGTTGRSSACHLHFEIARARVVRGRRAG